eukprot:7351291-Prymnesium_polylepis.1
MWQRSVADSEASRCPDRLQRVAAHGGAHPAPPRATGVFPGGIEILRRLQGRSHLWLLGRLVAPNVDQSAQDQACDRKMAGLIWMNAVAPANARKLRWLNLSQMELTHSRVARFDVAVNPVAASCLVEPWGYALLGPTLLRELTYLVAAPDCVDCDGRVARIKDEDSRRRPRSVYAAQ